MTSVPDSLIAAYRAADYEIQAPDGKRIALRIDQPNAALDRLLAERGVQEAAFLTAYNPVSIALCEAENRAADESLLNVLRCRGFAHWRASGLDPAAEWPPEPGFLVLSIGRAEAVEIAQQFDQYGLVYCVTGTAPELVLVR